MKVLFPSTSIIMTSHMKPEYLPDGIQSVVSQTRRDFQLILVDSGEWIGNTDERSLAMARIYDEWHDHPLIDWITAGQQPNLAQRVCPIGFVTNEVIRAGIIRGRYVCSFSDDDLYEPTFVERMAGFLDENPEHRAVWCGQHRVRIHADGRVETAAPTIPATEPKYNGGFDGLVDALQLMYHRSVLDELDDPWLTEDPADQHCRHSDGMFMDKVGRLVGVVPNIDELLTVHRYTPISIYSQ